MTRERWQQIEAIFNQALDLPASDRATWLATACADDPELRNEVEQLLRADGQETGIAGMQNIVRETAEAITRTEPFAGTSGPALSTIGPWRVTGILGSGGMGTVYRAERSDDRFRQQVAIKILQQGLESEFALARFRFERQILAGLDHPNIARLIDGGEVDDRPYIVMEFVEGLPVTTYCREMSLSLEGKLRLFRQICEAVQYAHQRLVIHRDLKPSNILVSKDGQVKLLDFGIAKLEDPDLRPEAAARTTTGMLMMTPEYASPEQVRGELVSASSDVYSLGAILYEMLTGERAHRLLRQDPAELVRVVCETAVTLPSTFQRNLRGDLDNIVLRALQKDATRRYATVANFSEDLQRFLDGQPVHARPDSTLYRISKFVQRNRWSSALLALLMLSLFVGTGISIYQSRRAERRFEQVRGLAKAFLFDVYDEVEPLPGATKARQMLVSTALTYLNSLAADAAGDRQLSLEVATAYQRVGDVLGNPFRANLGRTDDALASYRKSLPLAQKVAEGTRDVEAWRLVAWGKIKTGMMLRDEVPFVREGIAIAERIGQWQGQPERELLMEGHLVLGDNLFRKVGWAAALTEFEACLAVVPNAVEQVSARIQLTRSRCLQRAGKAQAATGDLDGAMLRLLEARDFLRAKVQAEPNVLEHQRNLLNVLLECGRWSGNPENPSLGEPAKAIEFMKEALQVAKTLRTEDPKDQLARTGELASYVQLALTAAAVDPTHAQFWLQQGDENTRALPPGGRRTTYEHMLDGARGRILETQGHYSDAVHAFERTLPDTTKISADQAADAAAIRLTIAHVAWTAGRKSDARRLYLAELPILQSLSKERPDDFFLAHLQSETLGMLWLTASDPADAKLRAQQAAALWSDWLAHGGKGDYSKRQFQKWQSR